jgi:hypothetical protein
VVFLHNHKKCVKFAGIVKPLHVMIYVNENFFEDLPRIYGPICINDTWRVRFNRELEILYNRPDIVVEIKPRIEWLGHVLRMESNRVPQKILDGRPEGKRSFGKPRTKMAG